MIAKSVFDYRWIQEIPKGKPILYLLKAYLCILPKKK